MIPIIKYSQDEYINNLNNETSRLSKNNFGVYVDISSYTSSYYTCITDGYVYIYGKNVICEIHSNNENEYYAYFQAGVANQYETAAICYVRKGMKLKLVGTFNAARFYQIITNP